MTGKGTPFSTRAFILLVTALFLPIIGAGGGGPTRAPGLDIVVSDITSHDDGDIIQLTSQVVTALVSNNGTLDYDDEVNVTLTVLYPQNETSMSVVFTETKSLGTSLSWTGNQTPVTFSAFMPMEEGFYAINVSVDAQDDHPGNNSMNITIRAILGDAVGLTIFPLDDYFQVLKPGESTSDPGKKQYRFQVRNDGIMPDTFTIDIDSGWAEPGWPTSTVQLSPGATSMPIEAVVTVPDDAVPGVHRDVLEFKATSINDPSVFGKRYANTTLQRETGVDVIVTSQEPLTAFPGGDWVYVDFLVINTGTDQDTFILETSARPRNWIAEMVGNRYITVDGGHSRPVKARIRIPELDFDTMAEDRTFQNDEGALVLRATSDETDATGSAEANIVVGLVHTVDMKVSPSNFTYVWDPESSPFEIQAFNFSVSIRSVNNMRGSPGLEMDINLSLPQGPYGVLFTPEWDPLGPNETQSERWKGSVAPTTLHLEPGERSNASSVIITAPRFPMRGTALSVLEVVPLLGDGVEGLALPARETLKVFVEAFIDFELYPPKTEYYPEFANGSVPLDSNSNGRADWMEGAPGDIISLPFNVTNTGNTEDFYQVDAAVWPVEPASTTPEQWNIGYNKYTEDILPFKYFPEVSDYSDLVWILVRVPNGAPIGESANITVRLTSALSLDERFSDAPVERRASFQIYVIQGFGIDLEPEESSGEAEPDETIEYNLNVTNTGNGVDTVSFIPIIPDLKGWDISFEENDIELDPLDMRTVKLFVTPSSDSSANDVLDIRIRAQSRMSPTTYDDVWVNTTVKYVGGVVLELLSESPLIWRYPGEIATFEAQVTNTGNGNDTFRLDIEMGSDSWVGIVDFGDRVGATTEVDIAKDETKRFFVNISLPSLLQADTYQDLEILGILSQTKIGNMLTARPKKDEEKTSSMELTVGVLQQYKADLKLHALETSTSKDVLVGEQVQFMLVVQNRGNGEDDITTLHSSPTGSSRHFSWAYVDIGPHRLSPFEFKVVNLTIEPRASDLPLFGERVNIRVEATAGNDVTYRTMNVSARIVMTKLIDHSLRIDLGTEGSIGLKVCNMPDPGETPISGFPLSKVYDINASIDTQTASGEGWYLPEPTRVLSLYDAYEIREIYIPIMAPPDLITNSISANINIIINGGENKVESQKMVATAVYFDVWIDTDATRYENLYEGRTGRAYITIYSAGTRGQELIPILVKVDGKEIGRYNAGPAAPQNLGGNPEEIKFMVEFDLPSLKWYEKGKSLDLEVVVDPDDDIVENTRSGRSLAETNNMLKTKFVIKNYSPAWYVLLIFGLLLIFAAAFGIVGYFFLDRRDSWFMIPLSVGLTGLFSMLFYFPIEHSYLNAANVFGLIVIIIDLVFLIPIMVFLYTRSGDAYILNLINKRRKREIIEGHEVTSSMVKPVVISAVGGLLIVLVPLLFWVVPSEVKGGIGSVLEAFVSFEGGFPVWILLVAVPAIAVSLQLVLIQLKRGSLKQIEATWDDLERLKIEIEEGFR
ncbi:MAG: hypothetical protein ACMUIE_01505 [Thermoplasmatota archaeon]